LGTGALQNNNTGTNNTAIGVDALFTNITGDSNVAIGYQALAFGAYAGSFNIAIGSNADVHGNVTNATTIGFAALVDASNKIRLGNDFATVIEGPVPFTNVSDKTKKPKLPAGRWRKSVGQDSRL
jgi:hypothetical protein